MLFSSMVFLWKFLPFVLLPYIVLEIMCQEWEKTKRVTEICKNMLLLLASLFFYSWGEPSYVVLMVVSILLNYFVGLGISAARGNMQGKAILTFGIGANLLLLGYYKYFDFVIASINGIMKLAGGDGVLEVKEIALPIGISFFTFQAMSYIIDLYRGEYQVQKNPFDLALYISFFPQLIAGPIVKYRDINAEIRHRRVSEEDFAAGVRRFSYGLSKKVLISNIMGECADKVFSLPDYNLSGALAWAGVICYTLQIYYDFSGYSDMAIGLGRVFGFHFLENFNYPYISRSIQEFWRRWHISLGTWFREYVYIPLGGNRLGIGRTYVNLLIVFFLTGLWHGASWTFVLWGLYHGIFLLIERAGWKKVLEKCRLLQYIYTPVVFIGGWVLFRSGTLSQALTFAKRLAAPWRFASAQFSTGEVVYHRTWLMMILGILGCGVVQKIAERFFPKVWDSFQTLKYGKIEMLYCMLLLFLSIMMLVSNTYNPFIYFRF